MPLVPVTAEVACSADVSYAWVPARTSSNAGNNFPDSAASAGDSTTPQATAAAAASPSAAKTGAPSPEAAVSPTKAGAASTPSGSATDKSAVSPHNTKVVIFARVERSGGSEDDAKAALGFEVERQKTRAAERCKRAHESVGECVATKLSGRASSLNSLSFSARTQAESALIDECKVQEGRCVAVESSTPTCRVKGGAAAETPPPAPAGQPAVAAEKAPSEGTKAEEKAEPKKPESGKPAAKKK